MRTRSLVLVAAGGLALGAIGTVARPHERPPREQGRVPLARPHRRALVPRLGRDRALAAAGQPDGLPPRPRRVPLVPRRLDRVGQRLGLHDRRAREQPRAGRVRPAAARVPDRPAPGAQGPLARRRARTRSSSSAPSRSCWSTSSRTRAARRCASTIAVTSSDTAHTLVRGIVSVLALALVVAVFAIVVTRYLRARGALRRALGPVLGTGALVMVVLFVQLVVDTVSEDAADPLYFVFLVTFALVPVAFLAGVLRSRLARSGVADLLVELGRGIPIRDALAHSLGDPSLDLVYWLPEREQLVLPDGSPFQGEAGVRVRHDVRRNGKLVGALIHDPSLADEPELVDAVAAAAALWLDNERLQAELRAQFAFLETIVNTAPSLLMSLDPDGRIVNYNTACERASGFENVEDVRHEYFWDVFISTGRARRGARALREEPGPPTRHLGEHVRQPARRGAGDRVVDCAAAGRVRQRPQHHLRRARRDRAQAARDRARPRARLPQQGHRHHTEPAGRRRRRGEDRRGRRQRLLRRGDGLVGRGDARSQLRGALPRGGPLLRAIGVASAFNGVDPQLRLSRWITQRRRRADHGMDGDADRRHLRPRARARLR